MFGRKKLSNWFAEDLAIDLGTANTLVFLREAGIVIREPSVVAVKRDQRGALKVLAVGREAKEMVGKTPDTIMAVLAVSFAPMCTCASAEWPRARRRKPARNARLYTVRGRR